RSTHRRHWALVVHATAVRKTHFPVAVSQASTSQKAPASAHAASLLHDVGDGSPQRPASTVKAASSSSGFWPPPSGSTGPIVIVRPLQKSNDWRTRPLLLPLPSRSRPP